MESIPPRLWALVVVALVVALVACRTQGSIARRRSNRDPSLSRVGNNPRYSYTFGAIGLAIVISIAAMVRYDWAAWQAWLAGANGASVVYYGWDKLAAKLELFRVPETTLHLLAVTGGTLGAIAGQQVFNHKSSKVGFQRVFWIIVVAQVAAIAWLAPAGGTTG